MRAPYPPLRGPPSPCGEGLDGATLRVDFYKGRCPKVCDGRFPSYRQPSPRGEGAPKGRIGHRRYERERGECVSSTSFMRAPYPPLCGPPSPCREGLGGATLRVDFCKRRCPKVAFKSPVTSHQSLFSHLNPASKMCYTVRNGRYHAACRDAGASPCIRMRKAGH